MKKVFWAMGRVIIGAFILASTEIVKAETCTLGDNVIKQETTEHEYPAQVVCGVEVTVKKTTNVVANSAHLEHFPMTNEDGCVYEVEISKSAEGSKGPTKKIHAQFELQNEKITRVAEKAYSVWTASQGTKTKVIEEEGIWKKGEHLFTVPEK